MRIAVPAKTFVVGEYLVLKGGGALILSTAPFFELTVVPEGESRPEGAGTLASEAIHPESPAGRFLEEEGECFRDYQLGFVDPYQGMGGLGASSAQFLLLYAFRQHLSRKKIEPFHLLEEYRSFAWNGKGMAPSGADVLAQWCGGLCFFHPSSRTLRSFSWPFAQLSYALIHTRQKLATHRHLADLHEVVVSDLEPLVQATLASIEEADEESFIRSVAHYGRALTAKGLRTEETGRVLARVALAPSILAAKGCGALGADVVLVLFPECDQQRAIEWLHNSGCYVITHGNQLASGLQFISDL